MTTTPVMPGDLLPGPTAEDRFRCGYREGAEALALALGCMPEQLWASAWGRRFAAWLDGDTSRVELPPPWAPTPAELAELRRLTR